MERGEVYVLIIYIFLTSFFARIYALPLPCSSLMADLEESGKVNDILKNLETDQTFSAVNRRANYNILNDVRQRKQFGSTEDVTGGQNAESTPKSGGWFGGWFGGGATNEADNAKSVEEGQGKRNRPKLM